MKTEAPPATIPAGPTFEDDACNLVPTRSFRQPAMSDELSAIGQAAVGYARDGKRVLPLVPRGKVPVFKTGPGHEAASADPDVVAGWFRQYPDANVGMVPAHNDLVVIDCDNAGARDALVPLGGCSEPTIEIRSGRDDPAAGHLQFYYPGGTPSTVLAPGLEVKSRNMLEVLPPSIHESGREYTFLEGNPDQPAPLPSKLLAAILAKRTSSNGNGAGSAKAAVLAEVWGESERHAKIVLTAGRFAALGHQRDEAVSLLEALVRDRCNPVFPRDRWHEIAAAIDSAMAKYSPLEGPATQPPAYDGPPGTLDATLAVFRKWLYLPDETAIYATLGAVAANELPGDPVWLGLIAPPSSAKTEILNAVLRLPHIHEAATLTPASLLSGTSKRDRGKTAKGGLLREIGDFGILICKDFGSVLSMRPEAKAETLGALRELYDGRWTRHVGSDGGQSLSWSGKLGFLFGATPALDSLHSVTSNLGERFILCRLDPTNDTQVDRAFEHAGQNTAIMRQQLADAVSALFGNSRREPQALDPNEQKWLKQLAWLAVRIRSAVERDRFSREIESIHGVEGPARLALVLERLLAGLDTLGCPRDTALAVVQRVALDSVPPLRRRALDFLRSQKEPTDTKTIAEALGLPTGTVRRSLEDLAAYGLARRDGTKQGRGGADLWTQGEI